MRYNYETENEWDDDFMESPEPDDIWGRDGWIDPTGRWYSCDHGEHAITAARILKEFPTDFGHKDKLVNQGWVVITWDYSDRTNAYIVAWDDRYPLTRAQKDTLYQWYKKHTIGKFISLLESKLVTWFEFEKHLLERYEGFL